MDRRESRVDELLPLKVFKAALRPERDYHRKVAANRQHTLLAVGIEKNPVRRRSGGNCSLEARGWVDLREPSAS